MKAPRISVVIDSFNAADFIEEAIGSVREQSLPADQIVVADASTDGSREIIERLLPDEPRLTTVFLENRGQLATILAGLAAAQGDLVFLLDGDDRYEREHLAAMAAWWDLHPEADLLYGGHRLFGEAALVEVVADRENHESAHWLGPVDLARPYDWGRGSALAWCLPDYHIGGITSSLSFRRRHLRSLPLEDLLLHGAENLLTANADYMLLLASALHGGRKVYVPQRTVSHRIHRGSITGRHAGGNVQVRHDQKAAIAYARSILCRNAAFGPGLYDLLESEMHAVPRLAAGHAKLYERAMAANPETKTRQTEAELRRLRAETFMLRGRVQAMESSTSWRLTGPVRWAGDKCAAVRRQLRIKPGPPLRHVPDVVAVDISNIWHSDSGTGIQRVVRTLATELARRARDGKKVVLVDYATGTPMDVTSGFLDGDRALPATPVDGMETLIMLDSSYNLGPALAARLRQAKDDGIRVISVCHDLLPLRFPRWFTAMNRRTFRRWLHVAADYSDHFACVSGATAGDLAAYFASRADLREKPGVSTWPLGRDIMPLRPVAGAAAAALPKPYALMVGTVEPRKNHAFVLEAFTRLRQSGHPGVSLVVVGRHGWKCGPTVRRLREAQAEGWAVWLDRGISDARLAAVYHGAACAIQASRAEGFGLPVAEAAHFGKPVVLSDIPVFREIVREAGHFFRLDDHHSFQEALARALQPGTRATETVSVTWRESAEAFWQECVGTSAGTLEQGAPEPA
jgi:glycosyltransferase involved in cell wall biosynthesis